MLDQEKILELAFTAMENAYCPYSSYSVGACVEVSDGNYFLGANIENASLGGTNCAERSAVFACYSYGYRKEDIVQLAIVSNGEKLCAPCGICRQVLCELIGHETPIILSNHKETMVTNIDELLPMQFTSEDLDK